MNNSSDYSSSIYHIYDQISDIAIINQQRQERKREQQAKKVRLIAISLSVLVIFTLLFLVMYQTSSNASLDQQQQQQQQQQSSIFLSPANHHQHHHQQQPQLPPFFQPSINNNNKFPQLQYEEGAQYSQKHAQFQIPHNFNNREQQQQQQQLNAAQICALTLNLCNGNGQCTSRGKCLCYTGFFGNQCEFGPVPPIQKPQLPKLLNPDQQQQTQLQQQPPAQRLCALALNNCHRNGHCTGQGKCQCFPGFVGDSCRDRDLCFEQDCSNRGICLPATGACQCKFGFRGPRCELQDSQAIERIFNCSSHGKFDLTERKCKCDQGYSGVDCADESCELGAADLNCGPNGLYDCRQKRCVCQDGYSGDRCQLAECSAQCQRNGRCQMGVCVCDEGFYGKHCSLNGCPNKCSGRGQCVRLIDSVGVVADPTAPPSKQQQSPQQQQQQQQQDSQVNQEWRCQCQPGAIGDDCSLLVERQCDDGLDNDGDGLIDCADSECCADRACQNSTLCMRSPDPLDTLMRKQPSPPTSSFFQRMQFLIERSSSQIYSNVKDFNDRHLDRASVVRGKVTYMKQGVTGVRVQVAGQINLGYTLTRDGGYFDLMVNGGGAVVIEFRREPFAIQQKAVRVPWNEIVLMDPVELLLEQPAGSMDSPSPLQTTSSSSQLLQAAAAANPSNQSPMAEPDAPACLAHNYRLMRPLIVPAPRSSRRANHQPTAAAAAARQRVAPPGSSPSRAVILRDSGMMQQSIILPASSEDRNESSSSSHSSGDINNHPVALVYISSRANEFMSTISIQLTQADPKQLPQELKLIHLKIVIEGNLFEQLFEPQANLSFSYAWNRRNVYKQKSFGLSKASVSVGYEYFDCKHVIWSTRHVQLPGHDLPISDVGSQWNLNIHHRYNYRDSVLQRGDGRNFNLKTDKPRVVQNLMGDGEPRETICNQCDGATSGSPLMEQRLLKPQALVSAPDGSLYVGDHNLIRRIERLPALTSKQQQQPAAASMSAPASSSLSSERIVRTVLELPIQRVPNKYSLAMNWLDQKLYMNDMDRNQILLIRDQSKQQQQQVTAFSQQPSAEASTANHQFGGNNNETLASAQQQQQQQQLEEMLIPVVGNGLRCQPEDRSNCGDEQPARLARLVEPRAMAFDLAGRMYIADGPNVRMVDLDGKIYTLLGNYARSRHTKFPCSGEAIPMHKFVPRAPLDLAMSPIDDALHILDDNVVYRISPDKRVQIVAGRLAHCLAEQQQQKQAGRSGSSSRQQQQHPKATEVFLQSARSIAFGQNGELFIGEHEPKQALSRVLLVSPEEETVSVYVGSPSSADLEQQQQHTSGGPQIPASDSMIHVDSSSMDSSQQIKQRHRSSNILPSLSQPPVRATDYKLGSVAALAVDQRGRLIVADELATRIVSVEPDLPQLNSNGEYELQSPDNGDELLVFNRNGYHVATRELGANQSPSQRNANNKYTFAYDLNTPYGRLTSVSYATGNKISIYREGPQHTVKMIETAFGGQCKLDISRNGQLNSITSIAPNASKTNLSYLVDGGLLRQSRDQATGEQFEFSYDEFGRATAIQYSSPALPAPVDCRLAAGRHFSAGQYCSSLIVAD